MHKSLPFSAEHSNFAITLKEDNTILPNTPQTTPQTSGCDILTLQNDDCCELEKNDLTYVQIIKKQALTFTYFIAKEALHAVIFITIFKYFSEVN